MTLRCAVRFFTHGSGVVVYLRLRVHVLKYSVQWGRVLSIVSARTHTKCGTLWWRLVVLVGEHFCALVVGTRVTWYPGLGRADGRWCQDGSWEDDSVRSWVGVLSWPIRQFGRARCVCQELSLIVFNSCRSLG